MEQYRIVILTVGAAILMSGGVFFLYQLFRLVQIDAACRGLKHPRLWGLFAASGSNQSGLLLYLIGRRKYPIRSMTEEQKREMERDKKKIGVGILFLAVGAIVCIWGLMLR